MTITTTGFGREASSLVEGASAALDASAALILPQQMQLEWGLETDAAVYWKARQQRRHIKAQGGYVEYV